MGDSTLPGCFALYPNAIPPNECEKCRYREDCKRYVPRDDVVQVFRDILGIIERVEHG